MAGSQDEIVASLRLDLGDMRAQLEAVKREQATATATAERTERKVLQAKRTAEALEPQVTALERKIAAAAKSAVKGGLAVGAAIALESLDLDEGFASSAARVGSAFVTTTLFSGGNAALGATAAVGTALAELSAAVRRQYKAVDELQKQLSELRIKVEDQLADFEIQFENRFFETELKLKQDAKEQAEQQDDMMYRASQYAELRRF